MIPKWVYIIIIQLFDLKEQYELIRPNPTTILYNNPGLQGNFSDVHAFETFFILYEIHKCQCHLCVVFVKR